MATKKEITQVGYTVIQATAIVGGVANTLTALGSTKDDAAVLQGTLNVFTTVAAGTGVKIGAPIPQTLGSPNTAHHKLSVLTAGDEVWIVNYGANALLVYPPEGGKINNGVADAAVSLAANAVGVFKMIDNINCVYK